jgi:hypothetical protein
MTHLHCASMIFWSRLWKYDDGFQRRTVKSTVKACLKPQEGTIKQKYDCGFQRRTVKSTVKVYLKLQERNREQVVHAIQVPK